MQDIGISYKCCHITGLWMIINLIRCSDLLNTSVLHHRDPVRHVDSFFLIMSDIDKCNSQLLLQMLQFYLHRTAKLQIQCSQRLIQKQYLGIIHQCSRNGNSLFLTAREFGRLSFFISFKLNQFQHLRNFFPDLTLRNFFQLQTIANILRNIHMRKERIILKYRIHIPLVRLQACHFSAVQPDTSCIGLFQTGNDSQRCRLAASRRSQQSNKLSFTDLKTDIIQNCFAFCKTFLYLFQFK